MLFYNRLMSLNHIKLKVLFALLLIMSFIVTSCKEGDERPAVWEEVVKIEKEGSHFSDLIFKDNIVYALAIEGYAGDQSLWRSTDAGKNWRVNHFNFYEGRISKINLVNELLFGAGKHLYLSRDHGKHWLDINPSEPFGSRIDDFYFLTEDVGFIARSTKILRTTDGGKSSEEVFSIDYMTPFDKLFFTDKRTVYVKGGSTHDYTNFGFMAKSEDGGLTWKLLDTAFANITEMFFLDSQIGFVFTFNQELFKTKDGGKSWQLVNDQIEGKYPACFFLSEEEGYYGSSGIFRTIDGGKTWKKEFHKEGKSISCISFQGGTGIATTYDGLILRKGN